MSKIGEQVIGRAECGCEVVIGPDKACCIDFCPVHAANGMLVVAGTLILARLEKQQDPLGDIELLRNGIIYLTNQAPWCSIKVSEA